MQENDQKTISRRLKVGYFGGHFWFKGGASYIYQGLTSCKKSESHGAKYENFCDRRTDRRTDIGGIINS